MSEASRKYTSSVLSAAQKAWLRDLPIQTQEKRDGCRFHLVHAMPSDPFYGRCPPGGEQWIAEIDAVAADVLLIGHSHVPFFRGIGDKVLLNPGSVGQPRAGEPLASYAVWQNGTFELKSFRYPVEATVGKLRALAFPHPVEAELVKILVTGSV
jgi:protein phosphatase